MVAGRQSVLPNDAVWAWQAKYLFEFGDGEATQVHKSVLRVRHRAEPEAITTSCSRRLARQGTPKDRG